MLQGIKQRMLSFELRRVTATCKRLERIMDDPHKDWEARLSSAIALSRLIDRKTHLERKLGVP